MSTQQPDDALPLYLRDEHLRAFATELAATPRPVRLVSFDFFDTLVHRAAPEPVDAFTELGRRVERAGLLVRPLPPEAFRQVRQAAEQRARTRAHAARNTTEVGLPEIWQELRAIVTDVEAGAELERATERDYCFLNPATTALARALATQGYTLAIVSDTYMSEADLCGILAHNGFDPSLFTYVLASCERGACKGDGSLFRVLHAEAGLAPVEMLHLGDNAAADVRGAGLAGVRGHHYPRTTPYVEEVLKRERRILNGHAAQSASFDALRMFATRTLPDPERDPLADFERDGAYLLGPALARFADWCVDEFVRAGVKRVLAPMREGELLGELLRRAATARGVSMDVVICYTSRQATALPGVGEATKENLQPLIISPLRYTVRDFFSRIGLSDEELPIEDDFLSRVVDDDRVLQKLLDFATQGALKARVEALSKEKRDTAWAYFAPLFGDERRVGIIDLGWAGTIQANLQRIAQLQGSEVELVGRYLLTNQRACARLLDGADVRSMLGNMGAYNGLARAIWVSPQPLEETINACVGSTIDYRRTETGAEPVLAECRLSAAEREKRERVQRGILHFQSVLLGVAAGKRAATGGDGWNAEMWTDVDRGLLAGLHRLITYPTRGEAERFGCLHREENFFSDYFVPICGQDARDAMWQGGVSELLSSRASCWPQGVVALDDAGVARALCLGWDEPHALGKVGQRPSNADELCSPTQEERDLLSALVLRVAPEHVLALGFDAPGDKALLAGWLAGAAEDDATPRLTHVETAQHDGGGAPDGDGPSVAAALTSLRRAARPSERNLLLVDRALPGEHVHRVLAQLAPFLGREATIAVGHGGREGFALPFEASGFRALRKWLHHSGLAAGYRVHSHSKLAPEVLTVVTRRPELLETTATGSPPRAAHAP